MDVLRPPVIWINGICYRKNTTGKAGGGGAYKEEEEEEMFYGVPGEEEDPYADESCDAFSNIEQTESGWRSAMDVPSAYFKFIIGKRGETKKRFENETKTQMRIPKQGEEGQIVIVGREKKGVSSARSRIQILVESGRQKQPFTHFLSFPIVGPQVREAFLTFKEQVLRNCDGDRGIDETIFQNPHKLHMTVGTLALMNDAEIAMATGILQQCQQELVNPILSDQPLQAQLEGLEYMNDDPNAVDVLYAKIHLHDESDRLQMLADRLVDKFSAAGLMKRDFDHVKLHVTVMNSLMRKDPSGTTEPARQGGGRQNERAPLIKDRESFDAANVLKNFGEHDFCSYHISTVHLSQRYSTGQDGYYACEAALDLL